MPVLRKQSVPQSLRQAIQIENRHPPASTLEAARRRVWRLIIQGIESLLRKDYLSAEAAATTDWVMEIEHAALRAFGITPPEVGLPELPSQHSSLDLAEASRELREELGPSILESAPVHVPGLAAVGCDLISLSLRLEQFNHALEIACYSETVVDELNDRLIGAGVSRHQALAHLHQGDLVAADEALFRSGEETEDPPLSHHLILASCLVAQRDIDSATDVIAISMAACMEHGYSGFMNSVRVFQAVQRLAAE